MVACKVKHSLENDYYPNRIFYLFLSFWWMKRQAALPKRFYEITFSCCSDSEKQNPGKTMENLRSLCCQQELINCFFADFSFFSLMTLITKKKEITNMMAYILSEYSLTKRWISSFVLASPSSFAPRPSSSWARMALGLSSVLAMAAFKQVWIYSFSWWLCSSGWKKTITIKKDESIRGMQLEATSLFPEKVLVCCHKLF